MTKSIRYAIIIIFMCMFSLHAFAQEVQEGSVSFDWILKTDDERLQKIEEIRDMLFSEGTVLKYNKNDFKAENAPYMKNKSYIEDYELIKSGVKEHANKYMCGFYYKKLLIAYGIQYKEKPETVYYYDAFGNIYRIDKVSSAYPNYPYWSYQYNKNGKLTAAFYNISNDDQYVYTPRKVFKGRWYKEKLYDKNAKVILTRSVW